MRTPYRIRCYIIVCLRDCVSFQVSTAAIQCRIHGIQLITVAAEALMANSAEMMSIASEPQSLNMFVTPTLSTVLNASDGVVQALCDSTYQSIKQPQNIGWSSDPLFGLVVVWQRTPDS